MTSNGKSQLEEVQYEQEEEDKQECRNYISGDSRSCCSPSLSAFYHSSKSSICVSSTRPSLVYWIIYLTPKVSGNGGGHVKEPKSDRVEV